MHKIMFIWVGERGSMVKNIGCSSSGTQVIISVIPVGGDIMPSSCLTEYQTFVYTDIYTGKTHTTK